ncbi:hypothetical protein [Polyangium aurulentum]|uniref:hypothetical protein n=1 Tax=Polyangium aurulentum TaxID=2567896 RepID=UPI0010AE61B6|nr:hypothetical protein [Polyangium aurulentum]UQA60375.1 hypothetical protein E8A73_007845 [Polyangium aurulentum]
MERAVENAYRVLDEQLRRGEEAARAYRGTFERGGLGSALGSALGSETLGGLPRSAARLWWEVLGLWLDVLGPLASPGLRAALRGNDGADVPWLPPRAPEPPSPMPAAEPRVAAAPAAQMAGTRVTMDLTAARPVEISLDLTPGGDNAELVVQDLGAFEGGGKPPITGVRLEPGRDGRLVLRLAIAPDQPPGMYIGMILDRAYAEQRGTLRVLVRG